MLGRDFVAYETCIIEFAVALSEKVAAQEEIVNGITQKDSWTDEDEEAQLRTLEQAIELIDSYNAALRSSSTELRGVVQAILEILPAAEFNEWDAQTKVAN